MTTKTVAFEGGSNGSNVTTTTEPVLAATVTSNTGTSLTYDNTHVAHGVTSCKVTRASTSGSFNVDFDIQFAASGSEFYLRLYMYMTANPVTNALVLAFGLNSNYQLLVTTSGTLQILNGSGSTVTTTTSALTLNAWNRVEWRLSNATSYTEVRLYSLDSLTLTDSASATSSSTVHTGARVGAVGTGNTGSDLWIDDVAISDTAWLGPVGTTAAGSITLGGTGTAGAGISGSLTLGGSAATTVTGITGSITLGGFANPILGSITLGGTATGVRNNPAAGSITLGGAATGVVNNPATGSITLGGTAVAVPNIIFMGWVADDSQQCLLEVIASAVLTVGTAVTAPPAGVTVVLVQGRHVVMSTPTLDANMRPVQPWTYTYA